MRNKVTIICLWHTFLLNLISFRVNGQAYCSIREPVNGRFDQPCLPLPGQSCGFNCFKLDGSQVVPYLSKRVVCMPSLQWSPTPFCDSSGSFIPSNAAPSQGKPAGPQVIEAKKNAPVPLCPDINPPEAGYTEGICVNATNNDMCLFGCLPGHQMNGDTSVKCLGDRWNGKIPECRQTPCTVTRLGDQLIGGKPKDITCIINPKIGENCSIDCEPGYRSKIGGFNASSTQCTLNGWNPPLNQICEEITCPDLTTAKFTNGIFTGNCMKATVNDFCSFSCAKGFFLAGLTLTRCNPNGQWQPQGIPQCLPPGSKYPSSTLPPPTEASIATSAQNNNNNNPNPSPEQTTTNMTPQTSSPTNLPDPTTTMTTMQSTNDYSTMISTTPMPSTTASTMSSSNPPIPSVVTNGILAETTQSIAITTTINSSRNDENPSSNETQSQFKNNTSQINNAITVAINTVTNSTESIMANTLTTMRPLTSMTTVGMVTTISVSPGSNTVARTNTSPVNEQPVDSSSTTKNPTNLSTNPQFSIVNNNNVYNSYVNAPNNLVNSNSAPPVTDMNSNLMGPSSRHDDDDVTYIVTSSSKTLTIESTTQKLLMSS